jgi:alkylation response protein AidB-like acyl-CoA dehydrogenase
MDNYFDITLTEDELRAISAIGLAHLGDAVYEILVRTWLCAHGKATGKGLHRATIELVRAEAQAVRARLKKYAAFNKMLTPMAKYYGSELSMRNAQGAIAVLGGSGFMKDYPCERYLRDSRITTIYEGTSQLQVVAAIAGVTGGLVHDVIDDILGEGWSSAHPRMTALLKSLDDAVEYVKGREDSKTYHDLSARKLVDAAIALIITALFVKAAEKFDYKKAALEFWLNMEFPRVKGEIEQVMSGYAGSADKFETLAPVVPVED